MAGSILDLSPKDLKFTSKSTNIDQVYQIQICIAKLWIGH